MRPELALTRRGLTAVVVLLPAMLAVSLVVSGLDGAASAALGAGIIAANQVLAALSTGWSRRLGYATITTAAAGFFVRMYLVLVAFTVASQLPWVHGALFVTSFTASLVVALAAECWSYARRSYVPKWRMAR